MKIIGGYRELSGEQFGIYIKRVVTGGLAAQDGSKNTILSIITRVILPPDCHGLAVCVPGRLKSGDLILDVNNISLVGVTNER